MSREVIRSFIEAYKMLSELWKTKSPEYMDRTKKTLVYDNLIKVLLPVEPNCDRDVVKKR